MTPDATFTPAPLQPGHLRRVHHLALNVKDMAASRQFYGDRETDQNFV